jgi:serine/threonine protein kinase
MRSRDGELSETEIIDFMVQFVNGYRELYNKGIVHRDIKLGRARVFVYIYIYI